MESSLTVDQVRALKIHNQGIWPKIKWFFALLSLSSFALGVVFSVDELKEALYSFHFSFVVLTTLFFGPLFFILVQHATASGWSVVVRRMPEAIVANVFVVPFFMLPSLFFSEKIFKWAKLAIGADPLVDGKRPYLNIPFLWVRSGCYVLALLLISWFFVSKSLKQDQSGDERINARLRTMSYPSLAIFALVVTFFGIDFIKSLDPHWYLMMFGVYIFAGSFVGSMGFLILMSELVLRCGGVPEFINDEHRHDLGKLLFGFNIFWTYVGFSQFFLIWYANIPEVTLFFKHRLAGGWAPVSYALVLGHFIFPLFYLLPRTIKRCRKTLAFGGLWMLCIHILDMYWLIMPNYRKEIAVSVSDLLFCFGVISLLVFLFMRKIASVALVPIQDPRLADSIAYDHPL